MTFNGLALDRPESISPEVWRKIPPAPRTNIAILCDRGHTVTVRINRNGSPRYSVDGRRETAAVILKERYRIP